MDTSKADNWIDELVLQQRHRELDKSARESVTRQSSAIPESVQRFWIEVQESLGSGVTAYNRAMGREDLVVAQGAERDRPAWLEIYRAHWTNAYIGIGLNDTPLRVTGEYACVSDHGTIQRGVLDIPLTSVGGVVRADAGDGSPRAVARNLLTVWAAHFSGSPPRRS